MLLSLVNTINYLDKYTNYHKAGIDVAAFLCVMAETFGEPVEPLVDSRYATVWSGSKSFGLKITN